MRDSINGNRAKYYDLIYSSKDYKTEAETVLKVIARHKPSPGHDLLDVGCGTGRHLQHFTAHYRCEGVDNNAGVLSLARKALPRVRFTKMDMSKLRLERPFDVIT